MARIRSLRRVDDGSFTMRNPMIPSFKLLSVAFIALAAAPTLGAPDGAPPLTNDDLRVGAPPVLTAPPAPRPRPTTPMPAMPPRASTPPVVAKPVPLAAKPLPPQAALPVRPAPL